MKRKKYMTGGQATGVAKGAADIIPALVKMVDMMSTGYTSQPLVTNQQISSMNPYSDMNKLQFAMGGTVPIEAEGDEMLETPGGTVGQIQGPSHAEGGVDINVPKGTKIYSDRLKVDGKTMAERKKNREKSISKLEKLLAANPQNKILKNTLERTLEVNDIQEAEDMAIQEQARLAEQPKQRMAFGGYVWDTEGLANSISNLQNPISNDALTVSPDYMSSTNFGIESPTTTSQDNLNEMSKIVGNSNTQSTPNNNSSATGFTTGDYVGMAGTLVSALGPLATTLANRRGDKPNENYFRNFGRDALQSNENAQGYIKSQRENALEDLRQKSNAAKAANRNNARSVNTIRAMDLATDMGFGKGIDAIYDSFSQQMMQLLGQQSGLENQQDQMVMSGEERRGMEDKADRDAFFSNLSQNLSNLGTNVQGLGAGLNTNQRNKDVNSLMSQLSRYGLGFVRDENGNMVLSKI